jgi:hypothetical protein
VKPQPNWNGVRAASDGSKCCNLNLVIPSIVEGSLPLPRKLPKNVSITFDVAKKAGCPPAFDCGCGITGARLRVCEH